MIGKSIRWAPAVCLGALLAATTASASDPAGDGPLAPARSRASVQPRGDIHVQSNLVLLPVNVTDARNRLVTGLAAGEFRVFDGKSEQKVLHVSNDDSPLSVGIVFDASGSMAGKLNDARRAVADFLKSANPEDEFFLVTFNNEAQLAVPFTHDAGEIQSRLMLGGAQGRTALVDAVYLALHQIRKAANTRKALLVISDGGDNDSRYSAAELQRSLRESDAWLYAIGIYGAGSPVLPEEERGGAHLLSQMAEQTGGRHIAVERPAELPAAAAEIGRELRNQYVLAYSPDNMAPDGKYHHVRVKLVGRSDLRLSWRSGYFAPQE